MTTFASAIKEERHDEAEIRELARKMVEAHKLQAAKQASQSTNQQSFLGTSLLAQQQQQQPINPSSILNYLTRKPVVSTTATTAATTTTTMQTSGNMTSNSNGHSNSTDEAKPADDESLKGHFGWESFNGGKIHIPYIIRQTEKYCAVRIVESKLLNKYLNVLHQDLYNCTNIRSYYITDVEARLLDEINFRHCDQYFGKEKFSMKDLIVRLSDAQKFQQFLDVCYKKLTNLSTPNDKCGFIRINSESVVPYTVRDSHKMVPLFYFEGETDNLKLKADSLSGWDLSYLKFCCKVQGIRNELFASETVAVISLDDIKSYFPQGTIFEDYWPNKVVDTQLLMPQKSHNSTVNWTHPPPKAQQLPQQPQAAPQPQKTQQTTQAPQSRMAGTSAASLQQMYQQNMDMSYLRSMQTAGMTNQQASLAALALTNGWNNQVTQSQLDQMFRLTSQQNKQQTSSTRNYSSRQQQQQNQVQQQQMQSLLQSGLYPYSASSMSMSSNGHSRNNSSQQPPPLIRGQQQQQSQMSNGSTAQLQLRSSSSTTQSSNPSSSYPPYPASNSNNNSSSSNGNNVVTITRCPTSSSSTTPSSNNINNNSNNNSQNGNNTSAFLNRIPASTTITPTQYYNNKDHSLSSSLSIYPKNSQNGNARNIIQSNISPIIASPTRASPQAGYAKQPSISPASQMHNIPAAIQQQLDELFIKQNFGGISNPELLKQTLMQYTNMYAKVASQQHQQQQQQQSESAGNQSLNSSSSSSSQYPLRNKSVITTSRASAMDVIDLSNSPTPSRSMNTVAALQLQQAQAAVASAANKRAHNGTYLNGSSQSTTRSMQSSASTRLQQMQMQSALTGMNGYGSPYKIEKTYVENQMVHCINMIPYSPNSDMIIPLSELRDQFYPNANLDICKRVMQALEINLYSGTKPQYQAYSELGKTIADNVPFVRVCDVITFMPQINYMIRGQLVEAKNANKRTRIS